MSLVLGSLCLFDWKTRPEMVIILAGPINLQNRKTRAERRAEDAKIKKRPRKVNWIKRFGCQRKSLQLIVDITRFLKEQRFTLVQVCCGFYLEENQWELFVAFGKEGMSDLFRLRTCVTLINEYFRIRPEIDLLLNRIKDVPVKYHWRWETGTNWNAQLCAYNMEFAPGSRWRKVEDVYCRFFHTHTKKVQLSFKQALRTMYEFGHNTMTEIACEALESVLDNL
ncbi:hypothetical protein BDW74DRAFT_184088 [Aspergillus multicolor]|uniref:uncharacterized protein n=1 Tax=Aspergillus multicolor TaxID=41759 RepID=UPI003CCD9CAE